jgi:hypothetical protein
MRKLLLVVIILAIVSQVYSQPCLPDGIGFGTQADVDNFKSNHPGCTDIGGDVTIVGPDITNLNGLLGIKSIAGTLNFNECASLPNLKGLDSLNEIGGDISFISNQGLINLEGLENLKTIGGIYVDFTGNNNLINLEGLEGLVSTSAQFTFIGNNALSNFSGLDNLTHIGNLAVMGNPALSSLTGLGSLQSIQWDLMLVSNGSLANFDGLTNLEMIGRDLDIKSNNSLVYLNGLENLNTVGRSVIIESNLNLRSVQGLENLQMIFSLQIYHNPVLSNIEGLKNISFSDSYNSSIDIRRNDSLSYCSIKSICISLNYPDIFKFLQYNLTGCNTIAEIDAACGDISVPSIVPEGSVSIHPNPGDGEFIIETEANNSDCSIVLCSINGQELFERNITGPQTVLDIRDFPQGIYLVRLTTEDFVKVLKIVKY